MQRKNAEKTQERVMSQRLLQVAESSTSLWRMALKNISSRVVC
jgi:hypothetical protein